MKYEAVEHDVYLTHHGVKGMKWGVRKDRKTIGKKRKKTPNYDKHTKKPAKRMSNVELASRTERLKRERDYYKAREEARDPVKKSRDDFIKDAKRTTIKKALGVAAPMITAGAILYIGKKYNIPVPSIKLGGK